MHRRIPRCMSTQHPDNVTVPFFAQGKILGLSWLGQEDLALVREIYPGFEALTSIFA
mgnify:CR=1 FL=1